MIGLSATPHRLGLFRSVTLVVCLTRKNVTQDFAGAVFGASQATVSRRWDLLRPLVGDGRRHSVPVADLGYVGVEGIDPVPYKRFPGIDLNTGPIEFNTALSKIRAAVEHAIAHLIHGECSAKKAAVTEPRCRSTPA